MGNSKPNHERIKNILEMIRNKHKINNAEIARRLKVQQSTISGWEVGDSGISAKHMDSLSVLLKMPEGADLKYYPVLDAAGSLLEDFRPPDEVYPRDDGKAVDFAFSKFLPKLESFVACKDPQWAGQFVTGHIDSLLVGQSIEVLGKISETVAGRLFREIQRRNMPLAEYISEVQKEFGVSGLEIVLDDDGDCNLHFHCDMPELDEFDLRQEFFSGDYKKYHGGNLEQYEGMTFADITVECDMSTYDEQEIRSGALEWCREGFSESVKERVGHVINGLCFNYDRKDWLGDEYLLIEFVAKADDPKLRESIVTVCRRYKAWWND